MPPASEFRRCHVPPTRLDSWFRLQREHYYFKFPHCSDGKTGCLGAQLDVIVNILSDAAQLSNIDNRFLPIFLSTTYFVLPNSCRKACEGFKKKKKIWFALLGCKVKISAGWQNVDSQGAKAIVLGAIFSLLQEEPSRETWKEWPTWQEETQVTGWRKPSQESSQPREMLPTSGERA